MLTVTLQDIISAPPHRVLLKLAVLIFANLVLVATVGLVDVYFVSRLGVDALTALGFVLSVGALIFGLASAFGTGIRTAVAACFGRGDGARAAMTVTICSLATVPIFGALGLLGTLIDLPVFTALGATPEVARLAELYMFPIWCAAPFTATSYVQTSALQAAGATQLALKMSVVPVASNVALTPMLVFGVGPIPSFGIAGAGLATALAWTFSVVIVGYVLAKRGLMRWSRFDLAEARSALAPVFEVALPSSTGRLVHPLAVAATTAIIAAIGPSAVAAFGIVSRLAHLVIMGGNAVGASIHVVAAAARGANNDERVRETIGFGALLSFGWGLACSLILVALAAPVAVFFSQDEAVANLVTIYLRLGCGGLAFLCGALACGASFNAVARSNQGLLLGLTTTWAIQLPLVYLCARGLGWTGFATGMLLAQLMIFALYVAVLRRLGLIAVPGARMPSTT